MWFPPLGGEVLPPAWGPLWFLAVLLLFSALYAAWRAVVPRRARRAGAPRAGTAVRGRHLAAVALAVTVASYLLRLAVPLFEEVFRLSLAQAPAWVAGFVLGVVGAERGWFRDSRLAARAGRVALAGVGVLLAVMVTVLATGADIEAFAGGGTWQSLVAAACEGVLVATVPVWVVDVFRRRADRRGPVAQWAGRAAFAAFVLHQAVLTGLVLVAREVPWPPELAYLTTSALAVLASFGLGALVLRAPGVSRVL